MDEKHITEYFRRSYGAIDGLWFIKVEEKFGFDAALQIDKEVWQVLPKIQARMLKPLLKSTGKMEALLESLKFRLNIDGFEFIIQNKTGEDGFNIIVSKCPWFDLMVKSGREALAGKVGEVICSTDYSVWASEFGRDIRFELAKQLCNGSDCCLMQFTCKE